MKKLVPNLTVHEHRDLRKLSGETKKLLRVGSYYSKLDANEKARYDLMVRRFCFELDVHPKRQSIVLSLVRLVTILLIRIESAMRDVIGENNVDYSGDVEKWLLLNYKELRETISLLNTITHKNIKSQGIDTFTELRNTLRKSEQLNKSKYDGVPVPDGHDRRVHDDGVARTVHDENDEEEE